MLTLWILKRHILAPNRIFWAIVHQNPLRIVLCSLFKETNIGALNVLLALWQYFAAGLFKYTYYEPSLVPRMGGANILASVGYHCNPKNGGRRAAGALMWIRHCCEELMLREKKPSHARLTSWIRPLLCRPKFRVCTKMSVCLKEVDLVVDFQT